MWTSTNTYGDNAVASICDTEKRQGKSFEERGRRRRRDREREKKSCTASVRSQQIFFLIRYEDIWDEDIRKAYEKYWCMSQHLDEHIFKDACWRFRRMCGCRTNVAACNHAHRSMSCKCMHKCYIDARNKCTSMHVTNVYRYISWHTVNMDDENINLIQAKKKNTSQMEECA
jgi:hypothetical protein